MAAIALQTRKPVCFCQSRAAVLARAYRWSAGVEPPFLPQAGATPTLRNRPFHMLPSVRSLGSALMIDGVRLWSWGRTRFGRTDPVQRPWAGVIMTERFGHMTEIFGRRWNEIG